MFSHQPIHNGPLCDENGNMTGFNPFDNVHGAPEVYYHAQYCKNVKMLIAGHTHVDAVWFDGDLPTVTTECSLTQEPAGRHERFFGTPTETAFDVFSIKGNMVYMTRFGYGKNRELVLRR